MEFHRRILAVAAIALTPLVVLACYAAFGDFAARGLFLVDMEADYLSGVVATLLYLAAIQLLPVPARHRSLLTLLWLARAATGLGLMLYYEGYYGRIDARGYYHEGVAMAEPWARFAFGAGTDNMKGLVALLSGVTDSYTAIKMSFAFVGLIGVYLGYRAATMAYGRDLPGLLIGLGLFPSVLFWSSILGKEPISAVGIGLACLGAVGFLTERRAGWFVVFLIGVAIAAWVRLWLSVIFLAPMIATIVFLSRTPLSLRIAVGLAAVPVLALSMQGFLARFEIDTAQDLVAEANRIGGSFARGGSAQELEAFGGLAEMVAFMPVGMFTALFRPLPGEIMNPFGILAGLENAAILYLLVKGLRRQPLRRVLAEPVLLWAILTLLAWAAVYGFVSYHNLGTAFRFRYIVSPILLPLAIFLAYGPVLRPRGAPAPG